MLRQLPPCRRELSSEDAVSSRKTRLMLCLLLCVEGCDGEPQSNLSSAQERGQRGAQQLSELRQSAGRSDTIALGALPEASFDVHLGTGRETHMPPMDGDTLHLELGHQGLQHVLVSIQLSRLPQGRYYVDFILVRGDGVAISEPARVGLPFSAISGGDGVELLGYTLVVVDPALGVGHDAVLRVLVEGPDDEVGADQRSVHVEWAPEGWDPDA